MKGLLLKLSGTNSEAEAALRVVGYFDALTIGGATVEALVRGAAALAECGAGIDAPGRSSLRFDASGKRRPGEAHSKSSELQLEDGVSLWLEREGGSGPLDDVIVERLGVAARALLPGEDMGPASSSVDVALVETVLSEREPSEERTKALRRLGLTPGSPLVVVAVAPTNHQDDPGAAATALLCGARLARSAHIATVGHVAAVLVQTHQAQCTPVQVTAAVRERLSAQLAESGGLTVGVGRLVEAMEAHRSWASALLALRFAAVGHVDEAVVSADSLGTEVALAEIPAAIWQADSCVSQLRALADARGGDVDLEVLTAFLRTGSLRQAATVLHMHHSSVASRLARIEDRLGLSFACPDDTFQVRLALTGLKLSSHAQAEARRSLP